VNPAPKNAPSAVVRESSAPVERPARRVHRAAPPTCDSDAIRSVPWGKPRGRAVRAPLGSGWIVPGGVNPLSAPFGEGDPLTVIRRQIGATPPAPAYGRKRKPLPPSWSESGRE
jgi:hypothetical protein